MAGVRTWVLSLTLSDLEQVTYCNLSRPFNVLCLDCLGLGLSPTVRWYIARLGLERNANNQRAVSRQCYHCAVSSLGEIKTD